jgi:uncharacterized membrane-anchored protein YitT (DUF2179 family)
MMNTLSWLIYAAEISERVQGIAGFIALMLGLFGGFALIAIWIEGRGKRPSVGATVAWLMVMLPAISLASFLPSKNAIYMIAASEAGEVVVTHPDAVEMMGDLKKIIRNKVKELAAE